MIALSSHTRVAFVGVGRAGALPPWPWRVRRSARPGGIGEAWCPASHRARSPAMCRAQHSAMYRARALRATEPSRTEGSLSAESTVLSYTPWNGLSQALIYSLTVYPPSTAPAALYHSHCPLPCSLSFCLHLPLYSGSVLAFRS